MEAGRSSIAWVLLRLGIVGLTLAAIYLAVRASGLGEQLEVEGVRAVVDEAGVWRAPLFIALYALGILAHVPGSVFVGGGVLAFGAEWALVWSYLGALLGNLLCFGIVRLAGFRPLVRIRWEMADRMLRRVSDRPLGTVVLLRLVFPTTAPISYALAFTAVSLPVYLLGSGLGVLPQLVANVWIFALIFDR